MEHPHNPLNFLLYYHLPITPLPTPIIYPIHALTIHDLFFHTPILTFSSLFIVYTSKTFSVVFNYATRVNVFLPRSFTVFSEPLVLPKTFLFCVFYAFLLVFAFDILLLFIFSYGEGFSSLLTVLTHSLGLCRAVSGADALCMPSLYERWAGGMCGGFGALLLFVRREGMG